MMYDQAFGEIITARFPGSIRHVAIVLDGSFAKGPFCAVGTTDIIPEFTEKIAVNWSEEPMRSWIDDGKWPQDKGLGRFYVEFIQQVPGGTVIESVGQAPEGFAKLLLRMWHRHKKRTKP